MNNEIKVLYCGECPLFLNECTDGSGQCKITKETCSCGDSCELEFLNKQLLAEQDKNKELEKKIKAYDLQYKADSRELDEYFKKEPTYILTIEKLRDDNKKLIEALESVQNNLDNILLPDYEEDYGNYNTFYQQTSAVITQALKEKNALLKEELSIIQHNCTREGCRYFEDDTYKVFYKCKIEEKLKQVKELIEKAVNPDKTDVSDSLECLYEALHLLKQE